MVRLFPVLLLTSLCAACMPAVPHGPRVEPGHSFGATLSAPLEPRYMQGEAGSLPFLLGSVGLDFGYGIAAEEPDEAAYRVGLHTPALVILNLGFVGASHLDVYAQAPELWLRGWDLGTGIHGSLGHVMLYLQIGRMDTSNSGWYTTQGIYFRRDAMLWVPEIAYQWRTERRIIRTFATGGFGQQYGGCRPDCRPTEPRQALTVGVSLEVSRRPRQAPSR